MSRYPVRYAAYHLVVRAGPCFRGSERRAEKHIDTIVSTHGFPTRRPLPPHFGLERFYFTDLYGFTRWEAWKLAADNPKTSERLVEGPTEMEYQGVAFKLAACRDWSIVDVFARPKPARALALP